MSSDPPAAATAYQALPRVDDVLEAHPALETRYGRAALREAVRDALDDLRDRIAAGQVVQAEADLSDLLIRLLAQRMRVGPAKVVNAAGVIVHTNLGRAPLLPEAIDALVAAAGYCDLEVDLEGGQRGSRGAHVDGLLARATGAEDAMAVNNCAAALVLALAATAGGRQVVVSRGHLVEIGGSFRLPEVMASSGAAMVEVGTTNRTRPADYEVGDDVGALLTVHPSNFSQEGFVTQPDLAEVSAVARRRGVPHLHDAGSGLLTPSDLPGLEEEPSFAAALAAGADLVLASGDKLLGGPQAGVIAGRADLVQACRRHPLARALRLDKLRLAALSATLAAHLSGRGSLVQAMLAPADEAALRNRVRRLADSVGGEVREARTMIGGGSAPGMGVDGPVMALPHPVAHHVAAELRRAEPPIVARVERQALWVDLRTVDPADDEHLSDRLRQALARLGTSEVGDQPSESAELR